MLRRGMFGGRRRRVSLANGEVAPPPDRVEGGGLDDGDFAARPEIRRRLPVSPIYEGGSPYRLDRGDPPKLRKDRLYDRMCDWDFHGLTELDAWMGEREWVQAMFDLIHHGFAFDKQGGKLRLRKRDVGEHRQSVVELLSGLTLPDRIDVGVDDEDSGSESGSEEEASAKSNSGVGGDDRPEIPEAEQMTVDAAGKLKISVTDYVTDTCAILARKGMGKTYLAMVIAEEFLVSTYAIPFAVIDPTGCWSGLASTVEGRPAEHVVVIFGGEHGHYDLGAASGKVMARLLMRLKIPCVFDLSIFRAEDQHRFVADFAGELYLLNRGAIHVFVDEADIFAPQKLDKTSKHGKRCLVALDNLTRRGRFRGVGGTLISQRPAVVNKDLLSQVGTMFFLQMIAPQDLSAVASWLHDNIRGDVKQACLAELPTFGRGYAYYLKGGDDSTFRRFKVRAKRTFDSSFTPKMSLDGVVPPAPEIADLPEEEKGAIDAFLAGEVVAPEDDEDEDVSEDEGGPPDEGEEGKN